MKKKLQVFNFSIQNQGDDTLDVYIDGDIVDAETQQIMRDWWGDETSVSYKSFRDQLTASEAKVFNIYINSYGGHVGDAMAMYDLLVDLQNKGKTVNTIGRGIIASAATYILMAGKNSEISKNSWFMVHNVSGAVWGDVYSIENYAKTLRKFNDRIRDFYAESTGLRKEEISKLMDQETWMAGDETVNKGFVKKLSGEASFKNAIPKEQWDFSNIAVLNAYNSAVGKPPAHPHAPENPEPDSLIINHINEMKKFFTDLSGSIMNAIKGIKPAEDGTQATLVNSIADAVSKPFENLSEQFENSVADQVKNAVTDAVKGMDIATLVSNAVAKAIEDAKLPDATEIGNLTKKIGDLEKKAGDLEQDIAKNKGKETGAKNEVVKEPIGKWNIPGA
jgi:ATP-dependent protease ClpP protease subunit